MALIKEVTCRQAVALVSDYLDGALSRRDRRRLEHHLADCAACSAYLDQMRATIALSGSVSPEDLTPEALDDLMNVFEKYQRERGSDKD